MGASATRLAHPEERLVRLAPLLALGASLARTGPLPAVSMAISALTVLFGCAAALSLGWRGGDAPVDAVPLLASSALAYGGGFLHAFSASAGALRRDRTEGIDALLLARAGALRGYLVSRIGGLALLLAATVCGGALVVGVVAALGSTDPATLPRTLQTTLASAVFGVAFAAVIAPIALAALGSRTRATGYLFLLAILIVPEVVVSLARGSAPRELLELCSVPTALAALRGSLLPGALDPLRTLRAALALAVFAVAAVAIVRHDVGAIAREREAA